MLDYNRQTADQDKSEARYSGGRLDLETRQKARKKAEREHKSRQVEDKTSLTVVWRTV